MQTSAARTLLYKKAAPREMSCGRLAALYRWRKKNRRWLTPRKRRKRKPAPYALGN
jgi:hypothetical protein